MSGTLGGHDWVLCGTIYGEIANWENITIINHDNGIIAMKQTFDERFQRKERDQTRLSRSLSRALSFLTASSSSTISVSNWLAFFFRFRSRGSMLDRILHVQEQPSASISSSTNRRFSKKMPTLMERTSMRASNRSGFITSLTPFRLPVVMCTYPVGND